MVKLINLRKKILKERGVELKKLTRIPQTHDELPSDFPKTYLMKLIELKYHDRLEKIIFSGSIYTVGKKLNISPATVSKWRKLISETREKKFWAQFPTMPETPESNKALLDSADKEQ